MLPAFTGSLQGNKQASNGLMYYCKF